MEGDGRGGSAAAQERRDFQAVGVVAVAGDRQHGRVGVRRRFAVSVAAEALRPDNSPWAAVGGRNGVERVGLVLPGAGKGEALGDGRRVDALDHGDVLGRVVRVGISVRRRRVGGRGIVGAVHRVRRGLE